MEKSDDTDGFNWIGSQGDANSFLTMWILVGSCRVTIFKFVSVGESAWMEKNDINFIGLDQVCEVLP